MVKKGQKIGSLGRSNTYENGGHISHLHFAIHLGSFEDGKWLTGYLSPEQYKAGNHGWVDPQKFLKTNCRTTKYLKVTRK